MNTATLPAAAGDVDEEQPRRDRRRSRRTVIVPEREAIDQGLRFRRHRTREREA
jgi:hypothetical protein